MIIKYFPLGRGNRRSKAYSPLQPGWEHVPWLSGTWAQATENMTGLCTVAVSHGVENGTLGLILRAVGPKAVLWHLGEVQYSG